MSQTITNVTREKAEKGALGTSRTQESNPHSLDDFISDEQVVVRQRNNYTSFNPVIGNILEIEETGKSYTLLERLGEGGDGVSFKAEDSEGELKVVKIRSYNESDKATEREQRFQKKYLKLNRAMHELGIEYEAYKISALQIATIGNFIPGIDLDEEQSELNRLSVEEDVFNDLADLIETYVVPLHEEGILHGDLKHKNLIRTENGKIKPIDFGDSKRSDTQTVTSEYRASWGFALDMEDVTRQHDYYSLAQVAMFQLTGEQPLPFPTERSRNAYNEERLEELNISDKYKAVLRRMLCVDEPYQNPIEIVSDLRGDSLEEITNQCSIEEALERSEDALNYVGLGVGVFLSGVGGIALYLADKTGTLAPALFGFPAIGGSLIMMSYFIDKITKTPSNDKIELEDITSEESNELKIKPRGMLGRTYDNIIGRDTPHRRYFRHLKELKRAVKKGLDYDIKEGIERAITLATEAGYDVSNFDRNNFEERYAQNRKKRFQRIVNKKIDEAEDIANKGERKQLTDILKEVRSITRTEGVVVDNSVYNNLDVICLENSFEGATNAIQNEINWDYGAVKESKYELKYKEILIRRSRSICQQHGVKFTSEVKEWTIKKYFTGPLMNYLANELNKYERWATDKDFGPDSLQSSIKRLKKLAINRGIEWDHEREKRIIESSLDVVHQHVEYKLNTYQRWATDGDFGPNSLQGGIKRLKKLAVRYNVAWNPERERRIIQSNIDCVDKYVEHELKKYERWARDADVNIDSSLDRLKREVGRYNITIDSQREQYIRETYRIFKKD